MNGNDREQQMPQFEKLAFHKLLIVDYMIWKNYYTWLFYSFTSQIQNEAYFSIGGGREIPAMEVR